MGIGIGTVGDASPDTLARTTVIDTSAGNTTKISFASGNKTVFCTLPSSKSVFLDADGDVTLGANLDVGGNLTVTGTTTFNGGTLTLGDANTDNIVFGGEVDSDIIPDDDGTFDLGSASKEWQDLFIDGTAKIDTLTVDENATVAGTLGVTGVVTANAGVVVDTMTLDGSTLSSTGGLILDLASNLTIDVDGTTITLADGGVNFGQFYNNASGTFNIVSPTQDKDIVFRGNDGGSGIVALTLDISNAGAATFNSTVTAVSVVSPFISLGATSNTYQTVTGTDNGNDVNYRTYANHIWKNTTGASSSTDGTERMRLTSTGLGIGTASPSTKLTIDEGGEPPAEGMLLLQANSSSRQLRIQPPTNSDNGFLDYRGGNFAFLDDGSEVARFQGSTVLIGKTSSSFSTVGQEFRAAGVTILGRSGGEPLNLNRTDSDGGIVNFNKDNTTIGKIGVSSSDFVFTSAVQDKDIIFKGDDGGSAITALTLDMSSGGSAFFNHDIVLGDNGKATFGAGSDLQIFHDGSHSFVSDVGTGGLKLTGGDIYIRNPSDADMIHATSGGAVTLYHNNVAKLATTSSGIDVTGAIVTDAGGTIGAAGTATSVAGIPLYRGDGNNSSIYTHDVSGTDSTAQYNTGYGITALDAITTGDMNIAIGYGAGGAINSGDGNICIGFESGLNISGVGAYNTLIGTQAGQIITTGLRNIFVGQGGYNMDTENDNLGIGHNALGGAIAGGEFNVAVGNYSLDALTSGDNNVALGYNAGSADTTGYANAFVGYQAGLANTTGFNNTFVGATAGQANTEGNYNTLIGNNAGTLITTGDENIFVGHNAGDGHDTENHNLGIGNHAIGGSVAGGEFNVAIGNNTLDALTSADFNTAVGYQAGSAVTTGGNNTLIGYQAGDALTDGNRNTALGISALGSETSGVSNTAIGASALVSSNGGNYNTSVGDQAGVLLTTGDQNTLMGYFAGYNITSASNNVLIGYQAGDGFDTENENVAVGRHALGGAVAGGEYNVAIGNYSLDALTTADFVTAVGYEAGTANTTGYSNVFIGAEAGKANTEGFNNTFVGRGAGQANTNADSNTFIGDIAGGSVTTGGANLMIGHLAGQNFDTESNNLGIGKSALNGAIAGGEFNVAIGNGALDALTSGDSAVAIGYQV